MTTWTVDEALKWADTWGPTDGEPPSGDQLALATLARAVRAAGAELASMRRSFEAADRERGELRASAEELAVLRDSAKDVLALIDKHSKLRDSHAVARLYAALALTAPKNG